MIPPGQLAAMRAAVLLSLDQTCAVLRETLVPNGAGGVARELIAIDTLPCRLRPRGGLGVERFLGEQIQARSDWEAVLPFDAEVDVTDRLEVEGSTYEIVALDRGRSDATEVLARCFRLD